MSTIWDQLNNIDSLQVEFSSENDNCQCFILDVESVESGKHL